MKITAAALNACREDIEMLEQLTDTALDRVPDFVRDVCDRSARAMRHLVTAITEPEPR